MSLRAGAEEADKSRIDIFKNTRQECKLHRNYDSDTCISSALDLTLGKSKTGSAVWCLITTTVLPQQEHRLSRPKALHLRLDLLVKHDGQLGNPTNGDAAEMFNKVQSFSVPERCLASKSSPTAVFQRSERMAVEMGLRYISPPQRRRLKEADLGIPLANRSKHPEADVTRLWLDGGGEPRNIPSSGTSHRPVQSISGFRGLVVHH